MYINFDNMRGMADYINNNIAALTKTKERLESESKRLSVNTGLDKVQLDIRRIIDRLDSEIQAAQKLRLSLLKITELYISCENRIEENIEGGTTAKKPEFAACSRIESAEGFGWTIE